MKKQTLAERWKELVNTHNMRDEDIIEDYNDYIKFNETPLHPSQFIPWDMEQNCPMVEPKIVKMECFDEGVMCYENQEEGYKYQQALDRVLFERFYINLDDYFACITYGSLLLAYLDEDKGYVFYPEYKTIADLGEVELNKNGIKLAGYDT